MEHPPPGPAPTDPYQWRESVLSTRSLSYITVMDEHEIMSSGVMAPNSPRRMISRNPSWQFPNFNHTRRNTLMSISSLGEDEEALIIGQPQLQQQQQQQQQRRRPHTAERRGRKDGGQGIEEGDWAETGELDEQLSPEPTSQPMTPHLGAPPPPRLPDSIASSRLFSLPLELRQIIWSYALSPSDSTLEISWPSTHLSVGLQPQLLLTCKAIYEESAEILYTTTNLSFAHPSDANIFRRVLASQAFSSLLPHFTLRIRSHDAKLWTNYFNSHSAERSLVRDFPYLRSLTIRWVGCRYDRRYTEEQNAHLWLKDARLQEVILAVRKCGGEGSGGGAPVVRVSLCVVLPEDILKGLSEGSVNPNMAAERCNNVIFVREAWLLGCFVRVEAVQKEGQWM